MDASRGYVDDFDSLMADLKSDSAISAIVAPAAAAHFPNKYLKLNGWLKSLGIKKIFDVSFGAELTVKSYIDHIKKNRPECVIAQPCPALVTYIEIYQPELLSYLAPEDSPMLHTIKMIKEYYPEEKNHRVAVVSPCLAKRREFDETGIGNYNVTLNSVSEYLAKRNIDLDKFPEEKFDNPPAERAVLFSSPGGLLETAKREISEIEETTAKMREIHRINLEVARSLTENLVDLDEANDDVSEMAEQLFRLIQKQEESFAIIVENSTSTLDVIEQINPLLATINDIADRTKMLSLNASIEAIRSRHDKNYLLTVIGVLSVFSKVMLIDEALLQRGCL